MKINIFSSLVFGAWLISIIPAVSSQYVQDTTELEKFFLTLKDKPSSQKFENYLELEWLQGSIELFINKKFEPLNMRYDLENNIFEIKWNQQVKLLEGYKVKKFRWYKPNPGRQIQFVNCVTFQSDKWLTGFFEVLEDGPLTLLVKTELVKPPEYQTGSEYSIYYDKKSKKMERKEYLYIAQRSEVYLSPKKKKDWMIYLQDKSEPIKYFMKENKLGFSKMEDIKKVIHFYNSTD